MRFPWQRKRETPRIDPVEVEDDEFVFDLVPLVEAEYDEGNDTIPSILAASERPTDPNLPEDERPTDPFLPVSVEAYLVQVESFYPET